MNVFKQNTHGKNTFFLKTTHLQYDKQRKKTMCSKPAPWIGGTAVEIAVSAVAENEGAAALGANA